jgi:hypothetical protein
MITNTVSSISDMANSHCLFIADTST